MSARRTLAAFSLLFACCASACLSPPADPTASRAHEDTALSIRAYDSASGTADPAALPRRPTFILRAAHRIDPKDAPVLLLTGDLDTDLAHDLQKAPLTAADASRVVPSRTTYATDGTVTLAPNAPLRSGGSYVFVVAGFARFTSGDKVNPDGTAFHAALTVSIEASAGAAVATSFPAAGSTGVPTNLRFCALVFDGSVSGEARGLWLENAQGLTVPAQTLRFPCDELAADGADCIALLPNAPLLPLARYALKTGVELHDELGASVTAWSASFSTGDGADHEPPHWRTLPCAPDERTLDMGCALVDDTHITLRAQVDTPARLLVHDGAHTEALLPARGELLWTRTGLTPDSDCTFDITALDAAGNAARASFVLHTEPPLATLSISEVRADPVGPEPAQEYVEITNYGDEPVPLDGFTLTDDANSVGATITGDAVAYPGAHVLLVPDAFDPEEPLDAAPPVGALLVHVGASLGKSGLANAGEPLYLRDPAGRRVSAAPAGPKPKPGVCIERIVDDPRSGESGSFGYDADDTCTPGL